MKPELGSRRCKPNHCLERPTGFVSVFHFSQLDETNERCSPIPSQGRELQVTAESGALLDRLGWEHGNEGGSAMRSWIEIQQRPLINT